MKKSWCEICMLAEEAFRHMKKISWQTSSASKAFFHIQFDSFDS